jgi:RNA polymerase sigma factor (sigma-70 family)
VKSKKQRSAKAEDNLGLAFKYAQKFCPPGIPIEDSDAFADALIGLVQAERDYDPTRLNKTTGKPLAFSTCAYKYMMVACCQGYRKRQTLDRLQPWQAEEEWQFGLATDESTDKYAANAMSEILKKVKLEGHLQIDLEMLLAYHLEELTLEQVGNRYGVTKERIRQRINRVRQHIVDTIDFELLEEFADVGSYRDGIQRWWEDDFDEEVLSRSQTFESRRTRRKAEKPNRILDKVVGAGAYGYCP